MKYKKTKANRERAERIAATVEAYDDDDLRSGIVDLLTDMQHYCAQNNIEFQAALDMSEIHFSEES